MDNFGYPPFFLLTRVEDNTYCMSGIPSGSEPAVLLENKKMRIKNYSTFLYKKYITDDFRYDLIDESYSENYKVKA